MTLSRSLQQMAISTHHFREKEGKGGQLSSPEVHLNKCRRKRKTKTLSPSPPSHLKTRVLLLRPATLFTTYTLWFLEIMFLYVVGLVAPWLVYRWYKERKRVPNKEDKYVYITGCDSGFGNLLARHLDALGFNVIAACYTEKGEDELKKTASDRLETFHLDVTDSESVSKTAASIKTLVGQKGLWAVVNNAGVALPSGPTDWLTIDDYKDMLAVNLCGVIDVTLSVLPLIKKARGRVVNVASVFGRCSPFGGPYCVSKFGVESFNDSLRINMAAFGVKVACIEPGFFRTNVTDVDLMQNNLKKLWDRLPQNVKDEYGYGFLKASIDLLSQRFRVLTDSNLMKVVGCMEHAVSAVHPRTRYSAGWDAKFFWLPVSYMPTFIMDRLFRKNIPALMPVVPAK